MSIETNSKPQKKMSLGAKILIGIILLFIISRINFHTESLNNVKTNAAKPSFYPSNETTDLTPTQKDSIEKVNKIEEERISRVNALEKKKWENSKAGKIQKKHPDWSNDDCENVAKHRIWIGMSLDMLKYERGTPNSANPSNYGNGTQWQWCWDDYTPSCFYGGDDGIITSYN